MRPKLDMGVSPSLTEAEPECSGFSFSICSDDRLIGGEPNLYRHRPCELFIMPCLTSAAIHNYLMPMHDMPTLGMPSGALPMLILRVLQSGSLHGYALAQRIHVLSSEVLAVEEGLLYPTLQKMLVKGWVTAEWGISETNRKVRFYRLTPEGRKHLKAELSEYDRVTQAIQDILRTA